MMKQILLISSSPRRGGNSDLLCDEFLRGARDAGHSAEKIFLADKTIHYCTGCGACANATRPCVQKDDVADILEKMVAADVLVLATPVYFYTMCAQLKTLIDRSCPRYTAISNKEFYFILTAADIRTSGPWTGHWRVCAHSRRTVWREAAKKASSTESARWRRAMSVTFRSSAKHTKRAAPSEVAAN